MKLNYKDWGIGIIRMYIYICMCMYTYIYICTRIETMYVTIVESRGANAFSSSLDSTMVGFSVLQNSPLEKTYFQDRQEPNHGFLLAL